MRFLISIILLLSLISGCDRISSNKTEDSILLVDLSVVAKAISRDSDIAKKISQAELQLEEQLSNIKKEIEKNLKAEKDKINTKKGKEDLLKALDNKAIQIMQNAIIEARKSVQIYQAELLNQFKGEVEPIVTRIAKRRNAKMVQYINDSILWFSNSTDITDEVISEFRANQNTQDTSENTTQPNNTGS